MKSIFPLGGALFGCALLTPSVIATTMTNLASFGGIEEPAQIYHPSDVPPDFTPDSFINITDVSTGTVQMLLRYTPTAWDGDRTTGNTDRQRAEVKTLGDHQLIHQTFEYTTTWQTNAAFVGSGDFCHITQLKPFNGEGSSGAPLVVTSIERGTSDVAIRYWPASASTFIIARPFHWSPAHWTAQRVRITTTAEGELTGEVRASINGDSLQGVTNVEVCRPLNTTEYYPKWGLYRGVKTTSGFSPSDFVQHSNVTANQILGVVATPFFSPTGGTFTGAQSVTITTSTTGASIRYTTDGSTPTSSTGTVYSGPLTIAQNTPLKAIAYAPSMDDSAVASDTYNIMAATPAFSPAGGSFGSAQTVTITSTTAGALIYYTTDGSTPTPSTGTHYSSPISISANTTLKAIASAAGMTDSLPATTNFTFQVAAPSFSPDSGTYTSVQSVALASVTPGATIRYTVDGSTPTATTGTIYSAPISINANTTLKAIAYQTGWNDSAISSATYTIMLPVSDPVFSVPAGTYTSAQSVAITTSTPGASIRYTTDGSTPTATTGTPYSSAITIGANTTLKAIAFESGWTDSHVTSASYVIKLPVAPPTFSPAAGTYTSVQSVSLATSTPGASIRYTTDGSTPSATTGTLYSGPISIGANTTLKAIAFESGWTDSAVVSATYTIMLPVSDPVFSVPAGTYTSAQSVAITTSTPGASIRYTTDGSTPTATTGTLYSGAISISSTTTVKAIAVKSGWTNSAVVSATYTITPTAATPLFSPAGGTYTAAQTVTITSTTSGASIRYTLDGSTPTATTGTLYSGPVAIKASATLKAVAFKTGFTTSAVATAVYSIAVPIVLEAESLTRTSTGANTTVETDTSASGGSWIALHANGVGDYVEFTLPTVPAGTYSLKMAYKSNNNRGILNLKVDGTQLGGTIDQYAATAAYPEHTFGTVTFAAAGTHVIRLTATGKNSASSGYLLSADRFTLAPQ